VKKIMKNEVVIFLGLILIGLLFPLSSVNALNATPSSTAPSWSVTVSSMPQAGGTTSIVGTQFVPNGNSFTISAYPKVGYIVDSWILDSFPVDSSQNTITLQYSSSGSHTLVATFKHSPELTSNQKLTISYIGQGDIVVFPLTMYGENNVYQVPKDNVVDIVPYKNFDGWRFDHWICDGKTYTDYNILISMNSNHNLVAVFVANTFTVSFTTSVGGYTQPTGIQTFPVRAPDYPLSQSFTATAFPNSGYKFDHWTWDDVTYTANPVTVNCAPIFAVNHVLKAFFVPTVLSTLETFGNTHVGRLTNRSPLTDQDSCRYQAPQTGTINSISMYIQTGNALVTFGVYSDLNGKPDKLISQSTTVATKSNSWVSASITAPINGGQNYWLSVKSNTLIYWNFDTSSGGASGNGKASTLTLPSNFGDFTSWGSQRFSMYATFLPT
jgi:hypothetical protein